MLMEYPTHHKNAREGALGTRREPVTASCAISRDDEGNLRVAAGRSDTCLIVQETLERVGDKWTLLVVLGLSEGPVRFNALQRSVVGISHRMLSVTLRKLERDGLVERTAYPEVPPRVEYALTPLGASFIEPAMGVTQWAVAADEEIRRNRAAFDRA